MTSTLAALSDDTLVHLTLSGQSDCFTVLMNRYSVQLRKRIRYMVPNAADAEDILQEVLLKAWRHLSSFRSESTFGSWVTRVAINEALQSLRRARHRPAAQSLPDFDAIVCPSDSPYQSAARHEVARAVRSAIVSLPKKYRRVLILRDLAQRTEREAAQRLQVNIPTVKSRLFRARNMLLTAIQQTGMQGLATAGWRESGSRLRH